jgi:hypothetical protein
VKHLPLTEENMIYGSFDPTKEFLTQGEWKSFGMGAGAIAGFIIGIVLFNLL